MNGGPHLAWSNRSFTLMNQWFEHPTGKTWHDLARALQ